MKVCPACFSCSMKGACVVVRPLDSVPITTTNPVFMVTLPSSRMATPLSPMRIFETLRAYQQTAALRAAIELDIFTAIGEGATTAAEIAAKHGLSERGVRILCDTVVTDGLLAKSGGHYSCAPDAAIFLDRHSPACLASVAEFLCSAENFN